MLALAFIAISEAAEACLAPNAETNSSSSLICKNPLCGRLLRTEPPYLYEGSGCVVGEVLAGLIEKSLTKSEIVLLGEVHDNPEHHKLRGQLIRQAANRGSMTALVFEHLRPEQQQALDAYSSRTDQGTDNADHLLRALEWDKSGWPKVEMFKPLFAAALAERLPIFPGDPPRAMIRAAARQGPAALADDERARLKLEAPLLDKLQSALLDELEASHCGLMPRAAFGNMAFAQRYRDAHLADALVKAAEKHGSAILLAGNGHLRTDRGVPHYLKQMAPGRKVVAVMILEVEDGKTDPEAYVPRAPDGQPAADYIVFTPRAERPDPCEEMRRHFKPKPN